MKNVDRPTQLLRELCDQMSADVLALTDEELEEELLDQGEDPAKIAAQLRDQALEQLSAFKRKRLQAVRDAMAARTDYGKVTRPTAQVARQRIRALFAEKPELSMAFRKGRKQSDTDWMSIWDDLVELGVLRENDKD
jgi:hypothetical protein